MTESGDSTGDIAEALEDFPSATAGPGAFLAMTADKTNHDDVLEAERALEDHEPAVDTVSGLEDFPSATAGPGAFLAATVDHPEHTAH
jgi:hypothetical protein